MLLSFHNMLGGSTVRMFRSYTEYIGLCCDFIFGWLEWVILKLLLCCNLFCQIAECRERGPVGYCLWLGNLECVG